MASEVWAECKSCSGTGLYSGMCEADGEAVVCLTCSGTGCQVIRYEPFVLRKEKRGIKTVRLSRGSLIATGVGAHGSKVTYAEFRAGKLPTP